MAEVIDDLVHLSIVAGEDGGVQIDADTVVSSNFFVNCFVGRFLTDSVIHYLSMRATLANVWHPTKGISISDLGSGRFLFRLYHELDAERIVKGGPWNFNSHLLIFRRLREGEDPMLVPLFHVDFWVYVHDVPLGFMSHSVAKTLGDFIGEFVDYDSSAFTLGFKRIMKLRVRLDVRSPLKRRKKLLLPGGTHQYVRFEYGKLTLFCFLCGRLGHGESFCPLRFTDPPRDLFCQWDSSLRAPPRRVAASYSKWLIDEPAGNSQSLSQSTLVGRNLGTNRDVDFLVHGTVIVPPTKQVGSSTFNANVVTGSGKETLIERNVDSLVIPQSQPHVGKSGIPHSNTDPEHFDTLMGAGEEDVPLDQPEALKPSWLLEESCEEEVRRIWNESIGTVPERLRSVSRGLDRWFRILQRKKRVSIKNLRDRIDTLNAQVVSDDVLGDIVEAKLTLNIELDKEELYWEQRARANWLKNGDWNTTFFHKFASERRRMNRISHLFDDQNRRYEEQEELHTLAIHYFSNLFSSSNPSGMDAILDDVPVCISNHMNATLLRDFSSDEVISNTVHEASFSDSSVGS
ncbi:hypothetical protein GQ457_09G000940 [Hibiscus cannabinus]